MSALNKKYADEYSYKNVNTVMSYKAVSWVRTLLISCLDSDKLHKQIELFAVFVSIPKSGSTFVNKYFGQFDWYKNGHHCFPYSLSYRGEVRPYKGKFLSFDQAGCLPSHMKFAVVKIV